MARSSSVISVSIIGDAKKLVAAVGKADKVTGGLLVSGAKVLVTGKVVKKGFDLIQDSLAEADRRGDAIARLSDKLGDLADPLVATSDNFAKIGASSQDMLELEAIYADLATSAGVAAPDIAASAEAMAVAALSAAQVHDADPTAIIDAIGKAAGGATRGLKPYGVDLTEAAVEQRAMHDTGKDNPKMLSETELAAARTALILEGFGGVVHDVTTGTGDLAQKQDELGAKFETVMGKIGAGVEGPLTDVLAFINDEIDAIPGAIAGWGMLGDKITGFAAMVLTPLAQVADALRAIIDLFDKGQGAFQVSPGRAPRGPALSDAAISAAQRRERERNGLGQ
jgi:hypothetical protein